MEKKIVEVPSELEELIPGFLANRKNDLDELKKFIQNNDFEAIAKIAHKIKGSAGGYGFDEMTEIAGAMEKIALTLVRNPQAQGAENRERNVEKSIEKLYQELKNIIDFSEVKYVS